MNHFSKCPYGNDCLLIETGADRDCEICRICRAGSPEEYAVHVRYYDGLSRILRFADLSQLVLDDTVDQVSIYRLDGEQYYSKESITFKPESSEVKQALFAHVKSW